jgi:AhpD family alkylhydroperoxidase
METLAEIRRQRSEAHRTLLSLGSKVYQAFLQMEEAAFAEGAMSTKAKELVAVGIAVATHCESCMQWHIEKASEAGATADELVEAMAVAMEMGGGRATVSARFALAVIEDVFASFEEHR